ncbi:hypothetical protein HY837_02940 [archaeon]|nr:hypothetical protein [archaeon]
MVYNLVFDEVILDQLKKASKNQQVKIFLAKILDRIEEKGPDAGKLIDSVLKLYEVKMMHPPIRLYYLIEEHKQEAYIFEYEMKTSESKQQNTINKIRNKIKESKS